MRKILKYIFLILFFTSLQAQTNNSTSEDSVKYTLKQVTVTATRSPEPILEIPYSVTHNWKR